MIRIIQNRNIFFWISGVLMLLSVVFLGMWGLRLGIDFTGGTIWEIRISSTITPPELRHALEQDGFAVSSLQRTGEGNMLLRMNPMNELEHQRAMDLVRAFEDSRVAADESAAGQGDTGGSLFQELRFESIGPSIGTELKRKALMALAVALVAMIVYIAWAFRKVSRPVASWKYGVGATIALFHDVLITIGVFAVLGHFFNIEIDALFVSAILTVLGFSVHDTIVVYDRTRENLLRSTGAENFEDTVNRSVNETLVRSINTSLTTLLVLVTLYFFGGSTIKNFALALVIGIFIGTYSSIFVASPLLLVWLRFQNKKSA